MRSISAPCKNQTQWSNKTKHSNTWSNLVATSWWKHIFLFAGSDCESGAKVHEWRKGLKCVGSDTGDSRCTKNTDFTYEPRSEVLPFTLCGEVEQVLSKVSTAGAQCLLAFPSGTFTNIPPSLPSADLKQKGVGRKSKWKGHKITHKC